MISISKISLGAIVSGNVSIVNGRILSGGPAPSDTGKTACERRSAGPFDSIRNSGPCEVLWTPGEPFLEITCDQGALGFIKTRFEGAVLVVETDGSFISSKPVTIKASSPELKAASVQGSGSVCAESLDAPHFSAQVQGSGEIKLEGRAELANLQVQGSGAIKAQNLQASDARVFIQGSGSVKACAFESAQAQVMGSGSAKIYGNPVRQDGNAMGSGSVTFPADPVEPCQPPISQAPAPAKRPGML